jgi:hypothetical protein
MNSRIFDGRNRPIVQHGDIEADPVDQDIDETPASTLELLESGIDVVEYRPADNPVASEIARTHSTLWNDETRRNASPPGDAPTRALSGATQVVEVPVVRAIVSKTETQGSGSGLSASIARPPTPKADVAPPRGDRWLSRCIASCRAFFAAIVEAGRDERRARISVDEILHFKDGRTVFIGAISGHRGANPLRLWWLLIAGKGYAVRGLEIELITSSGGGARRAIATREAVDTNLMRKHAGSIELVEIEDR